MSKQSIVVIGSGWSGFNFAEKISLKKYNVTVISPIRTIQYTPLLASAATGMFDFRMAEEPVRRRNKPELRFHLAEVTDIDFRRRMVFCSPITPNYQANDYQLSYDKIVVAPGCGIQTFGTPGADVHALFLRTTNDARVIQQRLLQMIDAATLPGISDERQREILSIRVVGAGAIGIEATAELHDLWWDDMRFLCPQLEGKLSISIHDIAETVLSTFDESLSSYALSSLKDKKVKIYTGSHIERVEAECIYTKEEGRLPFGVLIWATGNKASPLVEKLPVKKPSKGLPRILTNRSLNILSSDGSPIENAYAMGDAADIEGNSLPTLASIALQKAEYLARELNDVEGHPRKLFEHDEKSMMAYLGQRDGIVSGSDQQWTGPAAWLAWRSGSLGWTRSWRRKFMISVSWFLNWIGGRDIARRW